MLKVMTQSLGVGASFLMNLTRPFPSAALARLPAPEFQLPSATVPNTPLVHKSANCSESVSVCNESSLVPTVLSRLEARAR